MWLVIAQSENIAQVDSEVFRERLKIAAAGPLTTWLDSIGLKDTVYSALSRKSAPGPEVLVRLARASGRSIDWLLGLVDENDPRGVVGPYLRSLGEQAMPNGLGVDSLKGKIIRSPEELARVLGDATVLTTGGDRASYITEDAEFVYVKRYNVRASAGDGQYFTDENVVGRYAYQRDWWERHMPCPARECGIIECDGRSMEPDIFDREPILIHLADKGLNTDAVYVFRLREKLLVKRLQLLPDGMINVISSNKENYPPYQVHQSVFENPYDGAVIARVLGVPGDFRWIK